jgi:hypothetical protein
MIGGANMQKWLSLTLALLLVILLVACGNDGNSGGTPSTTEQNSNPMPDSAESNASGEETQNNSSALVTDPSVVEPSAQTGDETMLTVNIQVGSTSFTAILYDNASTQALLAQMPLILDMSDMNSNEKYYYLSDSLPTDSEQVGSINAGDLMLYGSDCLVLFYESFSTSYSYTKLGYIEDASGLADALNNGDVQITFSVDS